MHFNPDTFVEDARAAGFSPAQAMMLYDEVRRFAAPQVVGEETPLLAVWREMQAFAREKLEAVDSPEAFAAYRKSWGNDQAWSVRLQKDPEAARSLMGLLPRADVIARLSGMFGYQMPESWRAWEELGLEWNDVSEALQADRLALPADPLPADVTLEKAQAKLEAAVQQARLGSFSWPAAQGQDAATQWRLAQQLEQCADEMTQKTGWGSGALGLNGRVALLLGQDRSGTSGWCANKGGALQIISTSADAGWGPLAHEWMHAVDHTIQALDRAGVASQAWDRMHEGLDRAAWQPADRAEMAQLLAEAVERGWGRRPATQAEMQALLAQPVGQQEEFQRLRTALEADFSSETAERQALAENFAVMAQTELDLARQGLDQPDSLWTRYARRYSELATARRVDSGEQVQADYFLSREERATHSFEATFPADALVSDVRPNASLRYPMGPELQQHDLVWRRFFRAAREWASALPPVASPVAVTADTPLSLAARRRLRAPTLYQNPPLSPSPAPRI